MKMNKTLLILMILILLKIFNSCDNNNENNKNNQSNNIFSLDTTLTKRMQNHAFSKLERLTIAKHLSYLEIKHRELIQNDRYSFRDIDKSIGFYKLRKLLDDFLKSNNYKTELYKIYKQNDYILYVYHTYTLDLNYPLLILGISNNNIYSLLKGFSRISFKQICYEFFDKNKININNFRFICELYLETVEFNNYYKRIVINENNYLKYEDIFDIYEIPTSFINDNDIFLSSYIFEPETGFLCQYIFSLYDDYEFYVEKDTIVQGIKRYDSKYKSIDSLLFYE